MTLTDKTQVLIVSILTLLTVTAASISSEWELEDPSQQSSSPDNLCSFDKISTSGSTFKIINGCKCSLFICVCSGLGLTTVPGALPQNLTQLYLDHNNLTSIPNQTFCNYTQLRILDLSYNQISELYPQSFQCMTKLTCLTLQSNNLVMKVDAFPPGIFKPLQSLHFLKLNNNTFNTTNKTYQYPDQQLSDLRNLTTLYLDGLFNKNFSAGFASMSSLRNLTLAGYTEGQCDLGTLKNSTFTHLSQLTFLNISDCRIFRYYNHEYGALSPLLNLQVLDLSYNRPLEFYKLSILLYGLRDSKLVSLYINSIVNLHSKSIEINSSMVQNLPKSLEHIELRENAVESISDDVFDLLPDNLTYLDMGNNRFVFGEYMKYIWKLRKLTTVMLNGGGFLYSLPHSYTPNNGVASFEVVNNAGYELKKRLILQVPPNLKHLDMSICALKYKISELHLNFTNTLSRLKLSDNYFPEISGPVYGFQNVTYLNLEYNSIQVITRKFLSGFPGLKALLLGNNHFDDYLNDLDEEGMIFQDLEHLITLDLSHCQLTILPVNLFKGLANLEYLNLHHNNMWLFNINITHMTKLKLLNLTHTDVSYLPPVVRQHIDNLCAINKSCPIRVDLSFSPILCECNNLEFIKWMVGSRAFDNKFKHYMCKYYDSSYRFINDSYDTTIRFLSGKCVDKYYVFLAVVLATLVLLGFVLASIVYRFRWNIRYFYYAAILKMNSQKNRGSQESYKYDVFLSYSSLDESFVLNTLNKELQSRGLKLHVHGRDFATGNWIAANIVTAVKESRKTLVILTRHLLASKWCNYELQIANMESIDRGRPTLVFLLKESISSKDLGHDLLCHIKRNTYISYPHPDDTTNDSVYRVFWDKLAADLKR
ncbi:toll-like receptor 4 [Physella acuta]|uniref:toll-like receptor 4 n=1 Tax=Physella acuta TaxID=109671 RepID=UPI0027DE9D95|nr:toll-like receptor 4 [Physella acuta]